MINLLGDQRRQIVQAAATLTPAARMAFIADVESTLAQHCLGRPASNNDVQRAINCVLDAVAWPRSNNSVFMCDSKEVTTMTKQHDDDQFETLPDGRKVLRDQGRMSFSMMAMDAESILRSTVDDMQGKRKRAYTTADAEKFGLKDASAMHRPGFRFSPAFNYPHLAEWSEERTKCCVTGIDRDSLSGTDSREERCRWTGKTTHGLIASLLAAVLWTSA